MKHLTFIIVILSLLSPLISNAQNGKVHGGTRETGGTVNFTVTTVTQNGTYAPKHVLAIWIEKNTQFVKTRVAYANARKQYLYTWKAKSNYNVTDAITGPTMTSHGVVTAAWDCKDLNGNILPDGDYVLWIEFTEKHAQGPLYSIPFTKGATPQTINPPDQTNFKNMTLTFTPVTANFTANQTSVCVNENVVFTSNSSGATTYSWNFGNGAVPATANTVGPHTVHYTTAGTKTVSLTVNGTVVETKQNYITVAAAPLAVFDYAVNAYTATFTNNSTNATSYLWDFGDGNTSTQTNPSHVYTSAGNYTVTLSASNATCDAATTNHVVAVPVTANFTANQQEACLNEPVVFTSTSTNATSYLWNFGAGASPATANTLGPHTVNYSTTGAKTISLTVNGSIVETKQNYITVSDPPQSSFDYEVNAYTATFTNNSINATSYLWDFGDGNTSTQTNPTHVYSSAGNYTVILSSSNTSCDPVFSSHELAVPVISDFTANIQDVCLSEPVLFTSTSINAGSYLWNFGSGASPSTANTVGPHSVLYDGSGSKTISLTINGNIIETKEGYVNVFQPPTASYTAQVNGMTVSFTNTSMNASDYIWDFGDGNTSVETDPVHTYSVSGAFDVSLTASNSGCDASLYTSNVVVTNVGIGDNPSVQSLNISRNEMVLNVTSSGSNDIFVEIADLNGRVIYKSSGKYIINVNVKDFVKGLYILKAESDHNFRNYKFVVK